MAKEVLFIRAEEGTAREEEETKNETKQREEEEMTKRGEECDRKMVLYTIGDYFIIVLMIVIFQSLII